jgi:hypothetical protein
MYYASAGIVLVTYVGKNGLWHHLGLYLFHDFCLELNETVIILTSVQPISDSPSVRQDREAA